VSGLRRRKGALRRVQLLYGDAVARVRIDPRITGIELAACEQEGGPQGGAHCESREQEEPPSPHAEILARPRAGEPAPAGRIPAPID
jgi:hypothetical protein